MSHMSSLVVTFFPSVTLSISPTSSTAQLLRCQTSHCLIAGRRGDRQIDRSDTLIIDGPNFGCLNFRANISIQEKRQSFLVLFSARSRASDRGRAPGDFTSSGLALTHSRTRTRLAAMINSFSLKMPLFFT